MTIPDGNLFLSSLSADARSSLLKNAVTGALPLHTVLHAETAEPRYAYFLLSGLASVVTVMENGESAEVGFIGREGVVGAMHLLGSALLSSQCVMQLAGSAVRIRFADLQEAFDRSPEVRGRVLAFVQEHGGAVSQVAACNRLHNAEQRLTRWLLMAQDHTGRDTLEFTQEYLSEMIATQRSTVTLIAGALQERGLIRYSRGTIHMLDRPGLLAATCSCYPVIESLLDGLYRTGPLAVEAADGVLDSLA